MILCEINCPSQALMRKVEFNVLLPSPDKYSGGNYKTLWLLHGLSNDHNSWIRNTCIERYAEEYGIAVVMPNADRSWYTDTAYESGYFTFLTKELPQLCRRYFRGMSEKREDNLIAGLSMGGYGALKAALLCTQQYGGCASLSGSLDITRKGRPTILNEWKAIFNFEMEAPAELENSEHDLFAAARKNHADGVPFPKLFMWCGTEDSLLGVNRSFDALLSELNVDHRFTESEGNHTWKWWDLHIQNALAYLLKEP